MEEDMDEAEEERERDAADSGSVNESNKLLEDRDWLSAVAIGREGGLE
jgi:hypothetical protein